MKVIGLSPNAAKRLVDKRHELRKMIDERDETFGANVYNIINEKYYGTSEKNKYIWTKYLIPFKIFIDLDDCSTPPPMKKQRISSSFDNDTVPLPEDLQKLFK